MGSRGSKTPVKNEVKPMSNLQKRIAERKAREAKARAIGDTEKAYTMAQISGSGDLISRYDSSRKMSRERLSEAVAYEKARSKVDGVTLSDEQAKAKAFTAWENNKSLDTFDYVGATEVIQKSGKTMYKQMSEHEARTTTHGRFVRNLKKKVDAYHYGNRDR